jgi:hypothetical protein
MAGTTPPPPTGNINPDFIQAATSVTPLISGHHLSNNDRTAHKTPYNALLSIIYDYMPPRPKIVKSIGK